MASTKAYSMVRDYRLYGSSEANPVSHVVARVNFVPPNRKDFAIESTEGAERGASIIRQLLETEARAAQDPKAPGAIISANYDFEYLGNGILDGHPVYELLLKPKHQERALIDGMVYVDQNTYLVRRIEGDLSKSPSWWVKKVHTVVDFSDQDGMWMQTSTRAVAEIRIIGTHTLTGQAVSVSTTDESAKDSAVGHVGSVPPPTGSLAFPSSSVPLSASALPLPLHRPRAVNRPPVIFGTGMLGR